MPRSPRWARIREQGASASDPGPSPTLPRFLVALPPVRDLLLCAKHLFVEPARPLRCYERAPDRGVGGSTVRHSPLLVLRPARRREPTPVVGPGS
jgi:hypothetical protein